nr:hypothetical protein [Nanoarchaeota archaeon]
MNITEQELQEIRGIIKGLKKIAAVPGARREAKAKAVLAKRKSEVNLRRNKTALDKERMLKRKKEIEAKMKNALRAGVGGKQLTRAQVKSGSGGRIGNISASFEFDDVINIIREMCNKDNDSKKKKKLKKKK